MMKKVFLLFAFALFIQANVFSQYSLSGYVVNQFDEPLQYANVTLDGTSFATTTSKDGYFQWKNLKKGNYKLRISYVGYKTYKENIVLQQNTEVNVQLQKNVILTEEVIISAVRAGKFTPVAVSNIDKKEFEKVNLGQDLPYLLKLSPSVIINSDAGAGVGYTSFRVRGTDLTRINVTINGVPLNDPESHGVFWVNMPDFASSVNELQIQRGVGTSTNGAAAFGASMNINTMHFKPEAFAEVNTAVGSFNTFKNNVSFGTGLLNDKWSFDGRLSKITSDGYIDRAFSDLKSFYFAGGYMSKGTFIKAIVSSGKEKTYQAWNGVPKVRLNSDMEGMQRYGDLWLYTAEQVDEMIHSDARTYNIYTYENETDNYTQNHYQLHFSHQFMKNFHFSSSLFYVKGEGYYEQLKKGEKFSDYQLNNLIVGKDTLTNTNLIRQKWLDNDFYGATFSFNHKAKKLKTIVGGGWNHYEGGHFGEVIWAEWAGNMPKNYRWYDNTGTKTDFNIFTKLEYQVFENIRLFGDLQYRNINFEIDGIHDDLRDISQKHDFNFFNPKAGIFYSLDKNNDFFASIAVANREPSRSNYRDADDRQPKPERLIDYELGYAFKHPKVKLQANAFYMNYKDQLVLTGEINDVGAYIMDNIETSYRYGIELSGGVSILSNLHWYANATYSQNKVKDFVDFTDNWDDGVQIQQKYDEADLSFSPDFTAGSMISYSPVSYLSFNLISKYVSRQFIDNTSNESRSLDPYFVNDFVAKTNFSLPFVKNMELKLLVNNIFNHEYETNAWVYKFYSGGNLETMDGYFPQAGRNYLLGLTVRF